MVQIHVEVKVLDGKAPLLFAWWNKEERSVDTCLVTCPCQGYGLVDSEQQEMSSRRRGEQALSVGRLTKAFESSRVVSVLKGDLAPDINSLISDSRDKRRGRGANRREKKGHRAKKTGEGCGSNGTEAAEQIVEDGAMVSANPNGVAESGMQGSTGSKEVSVMMKAVQSFLHNSIPSPSGMAGTHSSSGEEPLNSAMLPHRSNDSDILPIERNALASSSCIPVEGQQQDTTGADPVHIPGEDHSASLDEFPTAVTIATEADMLTTLHEMIGHVHRERAGIEGDTAGQLGLETSAPFGGPEEAPLNLKEDSGADADHGSAGKPESDISGPKRKYKRKDKSILCELCGKTLTNRSIKKHMEVIHAEGERTTYRCDQCPSTFYHEPNLRRHVRRQHEGVRYKCRYCDKSYGQNWDRRVHENVHFPADQPIFVYKSQLARRKESGRLQRSMYSKETTDCEVCGKTVTMASQYAHMKSHSKETCRVCGKTIKSTSKYAHMLTHSKETFTCEICGATLKVSNRYSHMSRHTRAKTECCPHCTMTFYNKTGLRLHLRTHTKERPLICRYCDATFSRAGTRINHERLHTGERPYQCELCEKAWRDRPTYTQHMKKHHPGRPLMYLRDRAPPTKTLDPFTPPASALDPLASAIESIRQEIASVERETMD